MARGGAAPPESDALPTPVGIGCWKRLRTVVVRTGVAVALASSSFPA